MTSQKPLGHCWKGSLMKPVGKSASVNVVTETLERLRQGMMGALTSPDFEHFEMSTWAEFVHETPESKPGERIGISD